MIQLSRQSGGRALLRCRRRLEIVGTQVLNLTMEKSMDAELVLQGASRETVEAVLNAIDAYKARLDDSIQRTRRNLNKFEQRYCVSTSVALQKMTAEDLAGGDLEYVEWAGEAKLLEGLQAELRALDSVRYRAT